MRFSPNSAIVGGLVVVLVVLGSSVAARKDPDAVLAERGISELLAERPKWKLEAALKTVDEARQSEETILEKKLDSDTSKVEELQQALKREDHTKASLETKLRADSSPPSHVAVKPQPNTIAVSKKSASLRAGSGVKPRLVSQGRGLGADSHVVINQMHKASRELDPKSSGSPSKYHISDWEYAYGSVAIVVGAVLGMFGYRLYRANLFIAGCLFASIITYHLIIHREADELHRAGISALVGCIFGFFTFQIYPIGVFVLGSVWGASMVLILNGMLVSRIANAAGKEDNAVLLGCLATAALVFGLLPLISQACAREASWKQNLLIFVKTAIPGAYLVEQGLRMVISQLRVIPSEAEMARRATMPDEYYIITAATCMLAMLFVCLQWVATSSRSCSSEQVKSEHSPVIFQYNSNQLKPTQLNNTSHGLHT